MSALKKTVLDVIGTRMTAPGRVEAVRTLSARFRMIDVVSEGFVGAVWEPAAKVKLDVGSWDLRTYTPIDIDAATGRAQLLFFLHGTGPASSWAVGVEPGALTRTGGPKASLALTDLTGAAVFFGDETSLAAAATLQRFRAGAAPPRFVFEVGDRDESAEIVRHLGLDAVTLVEKRDDAGHLAQVVDLLGAQLDACSASDLVLTGNGRSIQAIRAMLKSHPLKARQRVKAYWSPGKIGLD